LLGKETLAREELPPLEQLIARDGIKTSKDHYGKRNISTMAG
jgi:hypothetical protein